MSVVDSGVDALRALVRAVLPSDVDVYDGPAEDRAWSPRAVTIAAAFEDDQNAVTVERAYSGAKPRVIETAEVACSVYAGSGDSDPGAAGELRSVAAAILSTIDAEIRRDRTLDGAVDEARLTRADWIQGRDSAGTGVVVGFVVSLVRIIQRETVATFAVAGVPGTYRPLDVPMPTTLAGLAGVVASPSTDWLAGTYVPLSDGTTARWTGSVWEPGPVIGGGSPPPRF